MQNRPFKNLPLKLEFHKNLDLLGFNEMTDIQAQSLPLILGGADVIAQAQTGSGKTVAFSLGILSNTIIADQSIQSLVLCPTRELATQVADEIRRLARLTENVKVTVLCGGATIAPQIQSLQHGAHIVVGTPGRVLDHIRRQTLSLREVRTLVLDEADRMLDMGFLDDIRFIIKKVPQSRQTLLFSATFPDEILDLSKGIQKNPVRVSTDNATQNTDIEQLFFESKKGERFATLLSLIHNYKLKSSLIFCTTKSQCNDVAQFLRQRGLVALAIHSDLDQTQRDEAMLRFVNQSMSFLVATDVAARGLDIKDLDSVINFEISRNPEVHVHRIGRTGRAGKKGRAYTIYNRSEVFRLKAIEEYMGCELPRECPLKLISDRSLKHKPDMITLKIFGGKKDKIRAGDILGALTKDAGIKAKFIGKINIFEHNSYVAIDKNHAHTAERHLSASKVKNRKYGMKLL